MTVSLLSRILANIFFTFRDHLTANEGEISYSSVLPTSALLMVKEAIPSRNGFPYSVFLRSGVTWVLCILLFCPYWSRTLHL